LEVTAGAEERFRAGASAVGAGGERVAAGVVERSPREWRLEGVVVGEG
jgi:hypothetical protein